MYTLIGSPATRAFRVVWAMKEMGLSYEAVNAGPHSPEISKVNPTGKVPALLVDNDIIVDSVAIVQYLADKHQKLTYAAGTIERAKQDSFTQFACDDLDGTCWTVAKHAFVLPEELRQKEAVLPAAAFGYTAAMNALDQRLGDNEYVMGSEFTVPDLIITHTAGWGERIGFDAPSARVSRYLERVRARPAYLEALKVREAAVAS